jgi:hypothetical protein
MADPNTPTYAGLKQLLFEVMKKNEGTAAFSLSKASDGSGYSYAWVQFDLKHGPQLGRDAFSAILWNAKDASTGQPLIADEKEVKRLYDLALTTNNNSLPKGSADRQLINLALDSAYGKAKIIQANSQHLDNLISHAKARAERATSKADQEFLKSVLAQLWLCVKWGQA